MKPDPTHGGGTAPGAGPRWFGPAALCRMGPALLGAVADPGRQGGVMASAALTVAGGALLYGFAFGLWRAPLQGVYAAVKLPALFFAVVAASGLLNAMLAQVLGAAVTLRAVLLLMLVGMAIAAAILGALSPVALLFAMQAPPPEPGLAGLALDDPRVAPSLRVFRQLLLLHVGAIGCAGLAGNLRLYRLLRLLVPERGRARRVLLAWLAASGFVGCELSWLFSPFLCKPNYPPHLLTRTYFEGNFYEHVFRALSSLPGG